MKTKMFYARSMSEGLKKISEEFGDHAIILSNRKVQGGIEIMAALEEGEESIPTYSYQAQDNSVTDQESDILRVAQEARDCTSKEHLSKLLSTIGPMKGKGLASKSKSESLSNTQTVAPARKQPEKAKAVAPMSRPAVRQSSADNRPASNSQNHSLHAMQAEIHELKSLLENQSRRLGGKHVLQASGELSTELSGALMQKGFSPAIARKICESVNSDSFQEGWDQVLQNISDSLPVVTLDPVHQGGVFAFVGMTGAGKTTTLSKIATRFVMQYGAADLLIISLDKFRLGSMSSLKSLSRLLKADLAIPGEGKNLNQVLEENQHRKLILIDTCGSELGREYYQGQVKTGSLAAGIKHIQVFSCSSSMVAMERDIQSNQSLKLAASIMTKVDESPEVGGVLSSVIRHDLPMIYWSSGQRIPDDLHNAGVKEKAIRNLLGSQSRPGRACWRSRVT